MRVLVTGGAGFIGSHLVDKLTKEGHNVFILDDLSGGSLDNIIHNPEVILKKYGSGVYYPNNFFLTDCRDSKKIDELMKFFKPEIVYHLACNAAENKSVFSPIDITSRSYDAFIKVLTPFIKYGGKRFVFTSSIAVYGSLQTPFKETDDPKPEDLYGLTKLMAEKTLKIMSKVHGFEYVIARPHNVYGERQNMTDPYRNVVTIFMNAILKGEPYFIYGDGEQRRCFSYIDDVVEALYKCGFEDVAGKTFNVGSDTSYSVNDLSKAIGGLAEHLPERDEVKIAVSDHSEAKKRLNYQDKTSLEEGIKKTWKWAKSKGYQRPVYNKVEIPSERLPKNWI